MKKLLLTLILVLSLLVSSAYAEADHFDALCQTLTQFSGVPFSGTVTEDGRIGRLAFMLDMDAGQIHLVYGARGDSTYRYAHWAGLTDSAAMEMFTFFYASWQGHLAILTDHDDQTGCTLSVIHQGQQTDFDLTDASEEDLAQLYQFVYDTLENRADAPTPTEVPEESAADHIRQLLSQDSDLSQLIALYQSAGNAPAETKSPASADRPALDCPVCDGKGKIVSRCSACRGQGEIDCSSCGGDGEYQCSSCGGTGENASGRRCSSCWGSGDKRCGVCSGHGSKTCFYCSGEGKDVSRCSSCGGDGER